MSIARSLDPRASRTDLHRRQWAIRQHMAQQHPDASAYIVRHCGPGLPSGLQVVITRPEHFVHRLTGGASLLSRPPDAGFPAARAALSQAVPEEEIVR